MAVQKSAHDWPPGIAVVAQFISWHAQYFWHASESAPAPPLEVPALAPATPDDPPCAAPALLVAPLAPPLGTSLEPHPKLNQATHNPVLRNKAFMTLSRGLGEQLADQVQPRCFHGLLPDAKSNSVGRSTGSRATRNASGCSGFVES